jgi:hypothetical protein
MSHTEDRRGTILEKHFPTPFGHPDNESIYYAMDEYFTERALELLQYMADNSITLSLASLPQEPLFSHKGTLLTKEQLFENFL